MLLNDCILERRHVSQVFCVDVRSFRHQHLNDVQMACVGCQVQRCTERGIFLVNVGACLDQAFDLLRIASLGRARVRRRDLRAS